MGKKAQARREATTKPVLPGVPLRAGPNWPLLALSAIGMILAGYLSWTALSGGSVKGCGTGSACDVVLSSQWATLLGMPTAFWGFWAYAFLAVTAFVKRVDRHWQYAWVLSFFGVLYSAYLTAVSVTILKSACPYCLTSLGLMTVIFALVTSQRPDVPANFSWGQWITRTAPVAGVLIVLLHLNYTGVLGSPASAEDPLARALAEHLTQKGAKFFGAQWCPHCQDQKNLFGVAAKRLPYIECSPDGREKPQAPICKDLDIKSYPTWIINGKRVENVLTMQQLAEATGFKAPTAQ